MSDDPNDQVEELHEYHPDSVLVDPGAYSTMRSIAGGSHISRKRTVGLMMEFAADRRAEFEDFVQETERS